jgi:hypothetical protein
MNFLIYEENFIFFFISVEFPLRGQKVLVITGDAKRTTVSYWWFCQGRGGGGRERRGITILSGESAFYPAPVIGRQITYNEGK